MEIGLLVGQFPLHPGLVWENTEAFDRVHHNIAVIMSQKKFLPHHMIDALYDMISGKY